MDVKTNILRVVGCAVDIVKMLLFSHFLVLKIRGVDASDMQNPRLLYNILNKDICKDSKDYVGFSYPGIVLPYTICLFPLIPDSYHGLYVHTS